jgi:phenylacetate-CoA ligase
MTWHRLKKPIKSALTYLPVPVRLGREFRRTYHFLKASEAWDAAALREFQLEKLRWLVQHAYQNVPYYRKLFDAHGIRPSQIQDFADFRRIPTLSKATVRQQLEALTATNYAKALIRLTTGGSTGAPMAFFRSRNAYPITLAFEWRNYNWNGYDFGAKVAVLRGHTVEPGLFEYHRDRNALVLSAYKMTVANLPHYLAALNRFQPKFILAYPSAIELLAQFIRAQNPPSFLGKLRGIFTSSETLYSEQKKMIEATFRVPVFDKYGNSEMVTMIGMCEKGSYHDFMEYSYTEILDAAGNEVRDENLPGEIVGTGFVNPALPLLRYRTGDRARTTVQPCACGRAMSRVLAIEGRVKEVIIARDGSQLPLAPILFGIHDAGWDQVRRIQFIQEQPGELQILAESANPNPAEVSEYVTRIFAHRLHGQFNFRVQPVTEIPLTGRGKFQYLIRKEN